MRTPPPDFYVIGGPLPGDAPSYLERQADQELLTGLQQGKFCYVLTSRQMGKSSLMTRSASRLRERGARVIILDMTAFGRNLSVPQWYDGMLARMGEQLSLEDEIETFLANHPRLSPLQQWTGAIREVLLEAASTPLTIMVDEIDAVLSMPFSTDEFFVAIREFYSRRAQDPVLECLSFALFGVATPSELIRDPHTTPFNIGQRIELRDFTHAETTPLIQGLGLNPDQGSAILRRIHHYSGGHPYLTQRLSHEISRRPTHRSPRTVDTLCNELFLSHRASERDENLMFVRERLLAPDVDRAGVLLLLEQVHRPGRVRDDALDPLVSVLRLSGVVRAEGGTLQLRNRIYARSFDRRWIRANLPQAELWRQRQAFQRGLRRAAGISAAIILLLGALVVVAISQRDQAKLQAQRASLEAARADRERASAEASERLALKEAKRANAEAARADKAKGTAEDAERQARAEAARANREAALARTHRGLAEQARSEAVAQAERARDLLRITAYQDLREDDPTLAALMLKEVHGISTIPVWRSCALEVLSRPLSQAIFGPREARPTLSTFSPEGGWIATALPGDAVRLWSWSEPGPTRSLRILSREVRAMAFSPEGDRLALALNSGAVAIFRPDDGAPLKVLPEVGQLELMQFSPRHSVLLTSTPQGVVKLWPADGHPPRTLVGHKAGVSAASFDATGTRLATASQDGTVRLWSAQGDPSTTVIDRASRATAVAFSPSGESLAAGFADGMAYQIRVDHPQEPRILKGHQARITSLAFSPDGTRLASTSADTTARVWSLADDPAPPQVLSGHEGAVTAVAFSPDGQRVLTGGMNGVARLWRIGQPGAPLLFKSPGGLVQAVSFSRRGPQVLTRQESGEVRVWLLPRLGAGGRSSLDGSLLSDLELKHRLEAASSACIPTSFRMRYLAETQAEADHAFGGCERGQGR